MEKALSSEKETKKFAQSLVKEIKQSPPENNASVIALEGELGSGKTKLTQFLAEALGVKQRITSPTFLIIKEYKLPKGVFKRFFHVDAYRIKEKELMDLGLEEIIKKPGNIVIVEWADKVRNLIPKNAWWLTLSHGKNKKERIVSTKQIHG